MDDVWPNYQPFEITKDNLMRQNEEQLQLVCNLELPLDGYFEVGSDFKERWHIVHHFKNDEPMSYHKRYDWLEYTFDDKSAMCDWILEQIEGKAGETEVK